MLSEMSRVLFHPIGRIALCLQVLAASSCERAGQAPPASPVAHDGPSAVASASVAAAPTDSMAARLDPVLEAAVKERRVVGAVLLVLRDGRLVYHRAVGQADREHDVPMREDALFRYASVSKPFVAIAALSLFEKGVLGLDDPVTRFLPDFRPRLAEGSTPAISIRQLLTHTSGLGYVFKEPQDGPYHRAGVSDGLDAPGRSFEDNARRLLSVPLKAAPGSAFHYSLSTDVLGEVIARAGGAPLPAMVARLVTRPLGLQTVGFRVADPARLATPYADGRDGPVRMVDGQGVPLGPSVVAFAPSRAFDAASYPSGGAGMVGTASEAAALLESMRLGGGSVLRAETAEKLFQDQLAGADPTDLGPGVSFGFASAIVVDPARAHSCMNAGTLRWGGAYGHTWFVDRKAKLTVVLMTNTAFEGMAGKLPRSVEHAVYGC